MVDINMQKGRKRLIEDFYSVKFNKPMNIKDIMKYLYIDKQMTVKQIAQELHISVGTVHNYMSEVGVSARKMYWK